MELEAADRHDEDNDKNPVRYLGLLKATLRGDWEAAKWVFDGDPSALTAAITAREDTPLHVAVSNNTSPQSLHFVRRLMEAIPEDSLVKLRNAFGNTALHSAAIVGNTEAAKLLVGVAPELMMVRNDRVNDAPIHSAARYGHGETVRFLLSVTGYYSDQYGIKLLRLLIFGDFYELAVYTLGEFPELAREYEYGGETTAILTLAKRPQAFPSGTKIEGHEDLWQLFRSLALSYYNKAFPASTTSTTTREHGAMELLKLLICVALTETTADGVEKLLKPPMLLAAQSGIYEMVIEIIKAYPDSICFTNELGHTVFHRAVLCRQVEVFNIFYRLGTASKNFVAAWVDNGGNNLLHLAGTLGAETMTSDAAGVQRELQWFNEVAKVVPPAYREMTNDQGWTPTQLFSRERHKLMAEGEKWTKETAGSFSFVAALVVTVSFAAVFTIPGGVDDKGTPHYLHRPSFVVFLVANALALFSSSTSLLMFLRIMTCKYSATDFLVSLPLRIEICLLTLFFSIAAMLVAFAASLYIVLYHKVKWVMAPIGVVAAVPAYLLSLSLVPPVVDLLFSTFGPNVFGKESDEIIA